jgi:dihydrofolate reductase
MAKDESVNLNLNKETTNKKDTLFIVGGGGTLNYLTKNPEAKKIPDKLISLINVELDRMAKDESVNLNLNKETTNQIDSIRNLPPEELLKKLDQDYYFRKFYYENLNK